MSGLVEIDLSTFLNIVSMPTCSPPAKAIRRRRDHSAATLDPGVLGTLLRSATRGLGARYGIAVNESSMTLTRQWVRPTPVGTCSAKRWAFRDPRRDLRPQMRDCRVRRQATPGSATTRLRGGL